MENNCSLKVGNANRGININIKNDDDKLIQVNINNKISD